MTSVAISKFKAECLALLERVRKTGQPLLVTRRGEPVAQILPPPTPEPHDASAFGAMAGTAREIEDILEPFDSDDWEVLG